MVQSFSLFRFPRLDQNFMKTELKWQTHGEENASYTASRNELIMRKKMTCSTGTVSDASGDEKQTSFIIFRCNDLTYKK